LQLVDVTVRQGDTLTLAVNGTSNLPAWVSYVGPNANLGDVTYRTAFVGYVPEKGIRLPTGITTTIDWRNVVQSKLYIDRNIVDAPIDDLSAPASVRSARSTAGAPQGGDGNLKPMKVADHVWFMNGNTFFEFDDHITMVEANRPEARPARGSRLGDRETGAQHAGILPPCRRGAVLPAGLPDAVQPSVAGLELSVTMVRVDERSRQVAAGYRTTLPLGTTGRRASAAPRSSRSSSPRRSFS
jgi:hypothetical protein